MKLLAIDIGNTTTIIGLFEDDKLLQYWTLSSSRNRTVDEIHVLITLLLQQAGINPHDINHIIVSSVVPILTTYYSRVFNEKMNLPFLVVTENTKTGMALKVDEPEELGADRIVNAVAGFHCYGAPIIIIDLGTAITADVVSKDGDYLGGVIAPGMYTAAENLFNKAAKLHRVRIEKPTQIIGKDTTSCLRAGIIYMMVGGIDRIVNETRKELGYDATAIATGGDADIIIGLSQTITIVDKLLTLKGLQIIAKMNIK